MTSPRVTLRSRRILVLGVLLLYLKLHRSFATDIELYVPNFPLSSLAASSFNTRYVLLTRPRPTYSHTRRQSSAIIFYLLIISGDVEVNPGPLDNQPVSATDNSQSVPATDQSQSVPATGNSQSASATGNSQPVPASMLLFA